MGIDAEELNELQQLIQAGNAPELSQINALVAEVWRLKTLLRGKAIELDSARAEAAELEQILEALLAESDALHAEVEKLKAIANLSTCQLEGRWSNCAVRLRKGGERATAEPPVSE